MARTPEADVDKLERTAEAAEEKAAAARAAREAVRAAEQARREARGDEFDRLVVVDYATGRELAGEEEHARAAFFAALVEASPFRELLAWRLIRWRRIVLSTHVSNLARRFELQEPGEVPYHDPVGFEQMLAAVEEEARQRANEELLALEERRARYQEEGSDANQTDPR